MGQRQTRSYGSFALMLVGSLLLLLGLTVGCGVQPLGQENGVESQTTKDAGDVSDTSQVSEPTPEASQTEATPDASTTDESKADDSKKSCRNDCDCPQVCTAGFCSNEKRARVCPSCDDSKCDVGKPCRQSDGSLGICVKRITCKDDCDCESHSMVCDRGFCSTIQRASSCKPCRSSACKPGNRCLKADKTIGTCPNATTCKHDCDCFAQGEVCEANTCQKLRRPSQCALCVVGQCKAGDPCRTQDGKIGTCPKPTTCKHDCDCRKEGKVCASDGTCQALRRLSNCLSCSSTKCKGGDPCYNKDGSIGKCKTTTPCKHDCDCHKTGMVCHQNTCQPLKRASMCVSCTGGSCKTGDPCFNKDGSIGTCQAGGIGTACKHDCDCQKFGLVCSSSTSKCAALRRMSLCFACTSSNCKAGDPCLNKDGSIGVCSASSSCKDDCDCPSSLACLAGKCQAAGRLNACPSCTSPNCPTNNRCRKKDGTLDKCCCTTSGCGTGKICCSGGAPPPPNVCGRFCTAPDPKTGQCPLFP